MVVYLCGGQASKKGAKRSASDGRGGLRAAVCAQPAGIGRRETARGLGRVEAYRCRQRRRATKRRRARRFV
jgi:hypothetical protein